MPKTLAEKILSEKSGTDAKAGDIVIAKVDLAFVQDTTGPLTVRQFMESGVAVSNPSARCCSSTTRRRAPTPTSPTTIFSCATSPKKTGCIISRARRRRLPSNRPGVLCPPGRCHRRRGLAHGHRGRPGRFRDGHGLVATSRWRWGWARTGSACRRPIKVEVTGDFQKGVYPKDLILHLIGLIGADGATYKSLEFHGSTIKNMSMSGRFTIANMAVEAGAKVGLFESDETTKEFLEAQGRGKDYKPLAADKGAVYEEVIRSKRTNSTPRWPCRIPWIILRWRERLKARRYIRWSSAPAPTADWKIWRWRIRY